MEILHDASEVSQNMEKDIGDISTLFSNSFDIDEMQLKGFNELPANFSFHMDPNVFKNTKLKRYNHEEKALNSFYQ
jgi:hypothetical protein